MKRVSVIIPFYSHLDWLYEAMEGVLAQTCKPYEIILVNDGSKEDLTGFLEKYGDRIVYLTQENGGPGSARNRGIRYASGDYIAFCDSDDVWLPAKLEKQVAFMESIGAKWCHTGFYYWWPQTGRLQRVNVSRDYDDIRMQRRISTKIATPSVILDRLIYSEGDFFFPENIRNGEDGVLYSRLAEHYPLALVEEPLLKVRMRGNNSQSHAIERFHLRADSYRQWREEGVELPPMCRFIYSFYRAYSSLFKHIPTNPVTEFIAKCLWTVPFALERVYVRYLFRHTPKDEKYILLAD